MTQPVQEPSEGRAIAGLRWQTSQLFRRPAPPSSSNPQFDIKVIADFQTLATGDGQFIFAIPEDMDNMVLTTVAAYVTTVSSSGLPTVQIRNVTQTADMLSTKCSIDASEFTSYTATTAAVIDAANDDVATGDRIAVDVDVAGTGAKGLGVILGFS